MLARMKRQTMMVPEVADNPSVHVAARLAGVVDRLEFTTPSHVYNPLRYAWDGQRAYLARYGGARGRVLLVGMNPGPWGMAQTGVPFGEVTMVREWFGFEPRLGGPLPEQHPKYPILGMDCHRSEGSGSRVWRWAQDRYGPPAGFFSRLFIWNYCPLLFIGANRNLIPERLRKNERAPLFAACDMALAAVIDALEPVAVIGIGRFAEKRVQLIVGERIPVGYLHHPSPANPAANRDWPALADAALAPWLKLQATRDPASR